MAVHDCELCLHHSNKAHMRAKERDDMASKNMALQVKLDRLEAKHTALLALVGAVVEGYDAYVYGSGHSASGEIEVLDKAIDALRGEVGAYRVR